VLPGPCYCPRPPVSSSSWRGSGWPRQTSGHWTTGTGRGLAPCASGPRAPPPTPPLELLTAGRKGCIDGGGLRVSHQSETSGGYNNSFILCVCVCVCAYATTHKMVHVDTGCNHGNRGNIYICTRGEKQVTA